MMENGVLNMLAVDRAETRGASDLSFKLFTPLTAGAVHFRFLHFILAHYIISAFKPVKDKK